MLRAPTYGSASCRMMRGQDSRAVSFLFRPNSLILSAADDGAEWKDALQQAQSLFQNETGLEQINQVFIGLGSNDVCAEFGHLYDGDLERGRGSGGRPVDGGQVQRDGPF